jgi:DNA-binding response OmpR family regulator
VQSPPAFIHMNARWASGSIAARHRRCTNGSVSSSILIADDDADVRRLIAGLLERAGHGVVEASDGREALKLLYARRPCLVLLDVTMPGLDGWQVLERVREVSDVPVLMLTALGEELDRVRGLRAGADDYVAKPFGRQELLARVEALLRRARGVADVPEAYRDELLEVDFAQRSVNVQRQPVSLTPGEFRLLSAFVRHAGQLLSRDQLLELAWGDAFSRTGDEVKLYVGYLRRKLGGPDGAGAAIETVRGFGYRYRPPGDRAA